MRFDEREDSRPGVSGCFRELLLAAVEEAVGRAVIGDDLVIDARGGERVVERGVVRRADVLIGSCLEGQDRSLEVGGAESRPRRAVLALDGTSVEADRTRETMSARGR